MQTINVKNAEINKSNWDCVLLQDLVRVAHSPVTMATSAFCNGKYATRDATVWTVRMRIRWSAVCNVVRPLAIGQRCLKRMAILPLSFH